MTLHIDTDMKDQTMMAPKSPLTLQENHEIIDQITPMMF